VASAFFSPFSRVFSAQKCNNNNKSVEGRIFILIHCCTKLSFSSHDSVCACAIRSCFFTHVLMFVCSILTFLNTSDAVVKLSNIAFGGIHATSRHSPLLILFFLWFTTDAKEVALFEAFVEQVLNRLETTAVNPRLSRPRTYVRSSVLTEDAILDFAATLESGQSERIVFRSVLPRQRNSSEAAVHPSCVAAHRTWISLQLPVVAE
jgi:hypothetical protein